MEKSTSPYHTLDAEALAQICDDRAEALQARAWHSESERNALREATAELLSAVAQQLSAQPPRPASGPDAVRALSAAELRAIIESQVEYLPLHGLESGRCEGPRHAWLQEFVAGGDASRR